MRCVYGCMVRYPVCQKKKIFLELEMGLGWRMSWSISESGRRSNCSVGMTCIPKGMGYGVGGDSIVN